MIATLLKRLVAALALVWGVLTLTFALVELAPGSAADAFVDPTMSPETVAVIRASHGLDRPPVERYLVELGAMARGDFGRSLVQGRPVATIIAETLPNTLQLSLVTLLVAQLVGLSIGVVQSLRQHSFTDSALGVITLGLYSVPAFWLALMLQLLFCLHWNVLPSSGMTDPVTYDYLGPLGQLFDRGKHMILPGVAMGLASAGGEARLVRSSMLEVIRQDYIRTARAKGLPEWKVIGKHALRNALLPVITLLGLNLPLFFSGSVMVEVAFAWPGMGRLIVGAIQAQDTPVILGCFFVYSLLVLAGNFVADVLYTLIDPRIRLS